MLELNSNPAISVIYYCKRVCYTAVSEAFQTQFLLNGFILPINIRSDTNYLQNLNTNCGEHVKQLIEEVLIHYTRIGRALYFLFCEDLKLFHIMTI